MNACVVSLDAVDLWLYMPLANAKTSLQFPDLQHSIIAKRKNKYGLQPAIN
jgi:hypothetical protein